MTSQYSCPAHAVQMTPCLRRVLALPRRTWTDADAAYLARELTALLRTPHGTMQLRPIQAIALGELASTGLLAPIRVGGGKTLISLLAPIVCGAKRPLLVLPAKLVDKTRRERATLSRHWQIHPGLRIESYELLGRAHAAELLDRYRPDLIVLDEAHRVKNPRAAVTKRIARYLKEYPDVRLVAMSGTVTRRSLHDYAHLLRRALGAENAPIPKGHQETEEWANALDEIKRERTVGLGALASLLGASTEPVGGTTLEGVRQAYRRRVVETPGVVATEERFEGASLSITMVRPRTSQDVALSFNKLRCAWVLPDGQPLATGLDVWRHARELALGFYYVWDPAPPKAWLAARKEWCSAARRILGNNRRNLDSELQVVRAVDAGHYPDAEGALDGWRAVRDSFEPNTVPVWIDDSVLRYCVEWSREPGIIWTEHNAFARRLSELSGLPYYGPQGKDVRGRAIEEAAPDTCIIASIASNSEGRNLQAWHRNLVTSPPASGAAWEQLLGRTHRDGQEADEVTVDVITTCDEHVEAMEQARRDAEYIESVTGQAQKILYADQT